MDSGECSILPRMEPSYWGRKIPLGWVWETQKRCLKKQCWARHWRLTPVTLATQEAEIRRIEVRSQPKANSSQNPISKKKPITKRAGGMAQGEGPEFKPQYRKKQKKNPKKQCCGDGFTMRWVISAKLITVKPNNNCPVTCPFSSLDGGSVRAAALSLSCSRGWTPDLGHSWDSE
jgi:hypothetical protein